MGQGPQLSTPRLRVWRNDDAPYEVQASNPELVMWDRTRARHKWPATREAPFLWMTFVAWAASRRSGLIPTDVTFEVFEQTTVAIEAIDADGKPLSADDEDSGDFAVPTNAGPELG